MGQRLSEEALANKKRYNREYARKNFITKIITFNKNVEEDIEALDWMNSQENGNKYVKRLLLEDKARQSK